MQTPSRGAQHLAKIVEIIRNFTLKDHKSHCELNQC